jgi:hypothetical protein
VNPITLRIINQSILTFRKKNLDWLRTPVKHEKNPPRWWVLLCLETPYLVKIPLFVSRKPRFLGVSGFQLFQVFEPQSVDGLPPNLSSDFCHCGGLNRWSNSISGGFNTLQSEPTELSDWEVKWMKNYLVFTTSTNPQTVFKRPSWFLSSVVDILSQQ